MQRCVKLGETRHLFTSAVKYTDGDIRITIAYKNGDLESVTLFEDEWEKLKEFVDGE